MSRTLNIRPYQSGDETAILALFNQTFGKPMSIEFWNWRFQRNPVTGPLINLAWDGKTLASHYAVTPVILSIGGEPHLTGLSVTTMTHPDYKGRGLFATLANDLYMSLANQDYLMVWGFPNDQIHRVRVRDLAWQEVYEIPMFRLDMNIPKSVPSVSGNITELNNFDERVDVLWDTIKTDHSIAVKRDRKYLNWRFFSRPQHNYRVFGFLDGDKLLGYVVFKRYETELDIVDILAIQEKTVSIELVLSVLYFCKYNHIKAVNTWLPVHASLHLDLEKLGFRNTHPVTYMGARLFKQSNNIPDITNIRKWYFTMSDSDVF
jgi:hypothetical protein